MSCIAFNRNLGANPNDDKNLNIKEINNNGYSINSERTTSFTDDELTAYYEHSLQIWEDFCTNLVFNDRNAQQLLEELKRTPDRKEYHNYFHR